MSIQDAIEQGKSAHQQGDLARAKAIYDQILAVSPEHPEALHLLGLIELHAGRPEEARELIERAIRAFPDAAHYHANLGLLLSQLSRWEQAIVAYERALSLHADFPAAREGLAGAYAKWGETLHDRKAVEIAVDLYRQSLRLRPGNVEVLNNLGAGLLDLGRPDEAIDPIRHALANQPSHGDARVNLGMALRDMRRFDESIEAYQFAASAHPGWFAPVGGLGMLKLLRGEFREGWRMLESRWTDPALSPIRNSYTQPQWRGEPLEGRRIMLFCEQGFGDVIQFVRYVPKMIASGGRVIIACPPELKRLLAGNVGGVEQWVAPGEAMPAHDLQSSLMSLPMVFDTTLETVPGEVPYLKSAPEMSGLWKQRLSDFSDVRRVGLAWAGRPTHLRDRLRSMDPNCFTPLESVPATAFFSLQVGREQPGGLKFLIEDFTPHLTDFAETAALIDQLDLVITVDSAVAHLAGAMGKPVWVLLPHAPDWRWMLDREDSPWYPTMRLFRQQRPGDWGEPIHQIVAALAQQIR